MAWPSSAPAYDNYDAGGDDPSLARSQLIDLRSSVASMIAARGAASGVCDLDASSQIPSARLPTLNYVPLGASGQLADANALVTAGFYYTGATWTGSVFAGTSGNNQGYLVHQTWANPGVGTNYHRQWFMPINAATYNPWIRIKNNGTWMPWVPLFTPDALAQADDVMPVTITGAYAAGNTLSSSNNKLAGATTYIVPAGKKLYIRRIRGYATSYGGGSPPINIRFSASGSITGSDLIVSTNVTGYLDTEQDHVIADNSGGGSSSTVGVFVFWGSSNGGTLGGESTVTFMLVVKP